MKKIYVFLATVSILLSLVGCKYEIEDFMVEAEKPQMYEFGTNYDFQTYSGISYRNDADISVLTKYDIDIDYQSVHTCFSIENVPTDLTVIYTKEIIWYSKFPAVLINENGQYIILLSPAAYSDIYGAEVLRTAMKLKMAEYLLAKALHSGADLTPLVYDECL